MPALGRESPADGLALIDDSTLPCPLRRLTTRNDHGTLPHIAPERMSHDTPKEPFDAAIIGGGPAGAAAARCLASWGHTTVLLARRPGILAIAESLPPSCLSVLERIGVRAAVERAGFLRATGNTVWWGAAESRPEHFASDSLGFQIDRAAFDRLLLTEATAAGVLVRIGSPVADVAFEANGARIQYDSNGASDEIRARWVLDCTGRSGLLARRGWRVAQSSTRTLALVGVWEAATGFDIDDASHTLVESYEGGWAWSVPVTATRRFFTVMVDPALTPVSGGDKLESAYNTELARTTHLQRIARRGVLTGAPWARDASPYSCTRAGERSRLLVGDAASFVDPLSSYGVKKALASAWLAAVVVHTSLTDEAMRSPALELYDRREQAMYQSLARRSAALSREAAEAHATSFWQARSLDDAPAGDNDADIAALREDPEVLVAFAEIRRRSSIVLRRGAAVNEVMRPTVRDNRVILEPHLCAPAFTEGVRYLRNVDLMTIERLATQHDQVPSLYEAYSRAHAPVPLPDFLGALSVLVGKGLLELH